MKLLFRKNRKGSSSKDNKVIDSSMNNENGPNGNNNTSNNGVLKKAEGNEAVKDGVETNENALLTEQLVEPDLINSVLPKELILRIFSFLDVISVTRCSRVCKFWNSLALDGSNWQYIDLFNFQKDVSVFVVENIADRCNNFLKAIRLENCRFLTDEAIKKLCLSSPNIEFLNLKQCIKLTDKAFVDVGAHLSKVATLNLESCAVCDEGLNAISNGCPRLQSIDISWCKNLSSEALIKLATTCKNIQYFSAKGLKNINDNVLRKLAQNSPNLITLNINNCLNISDAGVVEIANSCESLKHLSISNCKYLSDATLTALGRNCEELATFECAGCNNFSDNGFSSLTKNCHHLMRIDLEDCERITDTTLHNLAMNCSNLKHLTLSRCERITDEGIRHLGESNLSPINETLQVLELDNCPLLTDASLEQLSLCHNLVQLELYDCQHISRSGIKKLQAKMPSLKVHTYFAPSLPNENGRRPGRSCCSCKCCTIV